MEEDGVNPQMVFAVICELSVVRNICELPSFTKHHRSIYATSVLSVEGERGISRPLNHSLRNFFTQIMRRCGIEVGQHYDT